MIEEGDMSVRFLAKAELEEWMSLDGWILPDAGQALYEYALQASGSGVIVEIGNFAGKSLICLALALARSGAGTTEKRLFAIDKLRHPSFWLNLEKFQVANVVTSIDHASLQAAVF
jgi:hypothetical protein